MFFIPFGLYLFGMFLMKKVCLPSHMLAGETRGKEQILGITEINIFLPGNKPCRCPSLLDLSHAFGGGKGEAGLGSSFHSFATAAATKLGPGTRPRDHC